MFSLIVVLIPQVFAFEYLKATVHSQDVAKVPHRALWHPHLYLAKDSSGEHYEVRNSNDYYDVSISFMQTAETAPGVLNCQCRFVLEDLEDEEDTEFLQVIVPGSTPTVSNKKDPREISIESAPVMVQKTVQALQKQQLQRAQQYSSPTDLNTDIGSFYQTSTQGQNSNKQANPTLFAQENTQNTAPNFQQGNTNVYAQANNPSLYPQASNPNLYNSVGSPTVFTQANSPTSFSQPSNPTVFAQANNPSSFAQQSNPTFFTQANSPTLFAQANNPTLFAQANNPTLFAQANNPTLFAQANNPTLFTQTNNPTLFTQGNNPTLFTQANNPAVFTQANNPTVFAQANNPAMFAQANNPTVFSQTSNPYGQTTSSYYQTESMLSYPSYQVPVQNNMAFSQQSPVLYQSPSLFQQPEQTLFQQEPSVLYVAYPSLPQQNSYSYIHS